MNAKHKHYDVIVAWAAGEPIEMCVNDDPETWVQIEGTAIAWREGNKYRVKPKPEYPITLMLYSDFQAVNLQAANPVTMDLSLAHAIANAAIRHAIDSGQVIIAPKGE